MPPTDKSNCGIPDRQRDLELNCLKGKRIAIQAEKLDQEMELWVPYYGMCTTACKEEGAEVKVVGAGGARP